jgi:hypothetical protein
MAFELTNGSIVLVTIMQSQQSNVIMNTLHYQYSTQAAPILYTGPCGELAAAINTAQTGIVDLMRSLQSNSLVHFATWVQPVWPNRYTKVVLPYNKPGLTADTPIGMNSAMTITKTSAVAKRYGRGSFHLGGLTVGLLANAGSFNNDALEGGDLLGSALTANVSTVAPIGLFSPIVWNFKVPQRITPIDGKIIQNSVRVERRRTLGVGI